MITCHSNSKSSHNGILRALAEKFRALPLPLGIPWDLVYQLILKRVNGVLQRQKRSARTSGSLGLPSFCLFANMLQKYSTWIRSVRVRKREKAKRREKGKPLWKREVRISSVLLNLCKCATYSTIQNRRTRAAFIRGPRCGCTRRVGSICVPPREEDIVWIVSTGARLYGNKFPWEYRGNRGYFIPFCIDLPSYIAIVRH